ncbi:MAG: ABC transporter ATP-binding protein [Desulfobulbaceae bacterium]|nr:ABC transporter ATP-binding protein [Desulfobulbaceae bacterium]
MPKNQKKQTVTQKSLFYWAFQGNLKLQIILTFVIILIVFARVIPLEMQKRIINDSIALKNLNGLLIYCGIYIVAITAASGLKLSINYLQAVIGERAMNKMRKELYEHILSLPLGFFRTTQPGMVVSSLMTELSAAGTFAGMAFAVPITNILTLLAFAAFLLWHNTQLAIATLLIYPIVLFVIPMLQKKVNKANKRRVDLSRSTSSQIAESISGINEIQVHGAYEQENRKFSLLADLLKKTRIRWSLFRFGIKTTNNYFVSLGPFIVFVFGGYLVMHGQLELGSMVAFLSAQEKLFDPWKELIDFYQTYQDASVRYTRTMDYFDTESGFSLEPPPAGNPPLGGNIRVTNLTYDTDDGHRLLNDITFSLKAGEHLAVVGFSGSGKSTLIQCIGKMFKYSIGSIQLDHRELSSINKREIIKDIGYISQHPFIFTGTIKENLLYAHKAIGEANPPTEENSTENEAIDLDRMILVLQQAGLYVDVMRFGLDSMIEESNQQTTDIIIRIRNTFKKSFAEKLGPSVEFYDRDSYHMNSSVGENIIFGTSSNPKFGYHLLPENQKFRNYLKSANLLPPLLDLGIDLARQAVDILSGLDSVDLFFKSSPVPANRLGDCEKVLRKLKNSPPLSLHQTEQTFLLFLALRFTPSVHTMTRLPKALEKQILTARKKFPDWCTAIAPDLFNFYCESNYIHSQSILNNIIFGKVKHGHTRTQEIINQSILQLLIEEDYLEKIAAIGMEFEVGNMGDRLSGGQRQKLAIARVLLKQPKIILMDEATSALDNNSQSRIQRLMTMRWKGRRTVIAVVHRLDIIDTFDKIAVTKAGKLVEFGGYQELIDKKGILHELIYGRQ